MSWRASGRSGSSFMRASVSTARNMSNCVVAPKRVSPITVAGRNTVVGTSGSSVSTMCSQNFFVRAYGS